MKENKTVVLAIMLAIAGSANGTTLVDDVVVADKPAVDMERRTDSTNDDSMQPAQPEKPDAPLRRGYGIGYEYRLQHRMEMSRPERMEGLARPERPPRVEIPDRPERSERPTRPDRPGPGR